MSTTIQHERKLPSIGEILWADIVVDADGSCEPSPEYSDAVAASLLQPRHLPVVPRGTTPGNCSWCRIQLSATRPGQRFCSRKCRQSAWRIRRRHLVETQADHPLRFAYADPPYPGLAARYYRHEPTYAGEVDHAELIARLVAQFDGWALSTSARALGDILPLCPPAARVCAWVKLGGTPKATYGIHSQWEPLIVVAGRSPRPGRRDWLSAYPARGGGELMGRKPIAFCAWMFQLLGMQPGDTLADLFPGTGIVSKCWAELSSAAAGDAAGI